MKALQVLGGGAWGGGSVVVLATAEAMIARGDEVWVLALDEKTAQRFEQAGATAVRSPFWLRPINPLDIIPFFQLLFLCLRERFDLVATHTSKGGFLGRLAARLAGVPAIVHTVHGFAFHEFSRECAVRFYALLERLAARACDLIITVGEQHRQTAIRLGIASPDRIQTVLNGIDLQRFQRPDPAAARQRYGFAEDDLIIGNVTRLCPQKGIEHLIRSMPLVLAWHPKARLVIAGEGPLEAELRQEAIRAGIEDRVDFIGFRKDVPELLSAFDVFVFPSLREGLSISLMEAMAAASAIVASDIWGNREMISDGESGLLVTAAQPVALKEAICRVLSDRKLARALGDRARRDALQRFTQERMIQETLDVYAKAIGSRSRLAPQEQAWSGQPTAGQERINA